VSDKPESLYSQDRNPFDPSLQSHGANKRPFASLGPNKPAPPTAKRTKLGKPGALSELAQKNGKDQFYGFILLEPRPPCREIHTFFFNTL
jgi:hypothetical protein